LCLSIDYYDKALAADPNDVYALINKGYALSFLGQNLEAIRYYDKALAIDPNNTIALNGKRMVSADLRNLSLFELK
jgi:tetratricopeptide (TPR) repeat protein